MSAASNDIETGQTLRIEVDGDGIALITLDDASRPMNVVSPRFMDEMIAVIERIAADPAVRGAVITSAKPAFMAGADLKYLATLTGGAISLSGAFAFSQKPSLQMHRRLESCGKPFVAAINGTALGGGYELCLACHYRVMAAVPKALIGLPEVTVGLLPGSGGTQRLSRMIGVEASLPFLLEGKTVSPTEALEAGLVDILVSPTELIQTAKNWLLATPDAVRAWDKKGYKPPGGLLNPAIGTVMSMHCAAVAARTHHNYPAPIAILDCVFEGTLMPFDKALRLESKYFARLLCGPVARNLTRTMFLNKAEAGKLARRPATVPTLQVKKLGVLGAGMMGAGIALVAASAGIEVVLLDRELVFADKGRSHSVNALAKEVQRGKRTSAQAEAIVARITATVDYAHLQGCDLVIEAVFEDVFVKADTTRRAEAAMPVQAIMASNTSTLPISELAAASSRAGQFIGLHFFSPVERMPLVEVIVGKQTSLTTLANALDFVAQLKMTPIVVNDSRGFYTSRVFQTFIHEGMLLLEQGVSPALIENAAKFAGFPVGPLALLDEVTVELPWKIVQESAAALGDQFTQPAAYEVMRRMLEELKRPGKRYGKGFYEYPEGGKKRLWPGLEQAFPPAREQLSLHQVKTRLLYIQALETARCLEEGVLTHPADADVGAVLAWGFPSWTGGPLSLIETVGIREFVATCDELAASAGPRYAPSNALRDRARRGAGFYAP